VFSFPSMASRTFKLRAFRRMVKQLKPEVVHSYSFYTNFAAYWATWKTRVVAVGSLRSDLTCVKQGVGPLLGRLSAHWPRDHISNNFLAAEQVGCLRSLYAPRRVHVVRNGLDLDKFRSSPVVNGDRARILSVGSCLPVKRWDRVLKGAKELKRRGYDCFFQIAGDGPLRVSLEQQARDLGVADRVEFLGHTEDVPGLLAKATFLVHTSDTEGCPNVVIEAMACGRAVVATNVGDVPRLVEDGKTGFVVCRGDDESLADRMIKLVADHDLCMRMGEAGRSKAEREFGLDRFVSETLGAYRAAGWQN